METLRIGGVPEHFNMPWQLLLHSPRLSKKGIEASWKDFSGGTGAMVEALNNNEIDMAMLLTEGAVKGIDSGGRYRIVSFYVDSPLIWGIHIPGDASCNSIDEIRGKTYAISRYGSGSHLMSFVDAQIRGWDTENLEFMPVNTLDGAREAFKSRKADIFFWEKFTTKKYVDNGEFKRIGERPTPFACFVICVTEAALKEKQNSVYRLIRQVFKTSKKLYKNPECAAMIAKHYQLDQKDVENWLSSVRWTTEFNLDKKNLKKAVKTLAGLNLINSGLKYKQLIWKRKWTAAGNLMT